MGLLDRLRGRAGPRVAFLGIDGVPFSLIDEHPDVFEHLTAIMGEGTGGTIDSIVPPESSACWPSLTTGVNPGQTGVYGFQDREIGSYETYVPMGRDVRATRIWDRIEEADRSATVMNVPVTFPPQRNVQRMVSGFLSPDLEKACMPEELAEELAALDYQIDVNAKLGHDEDKTAFLEDAHDTVNARASAFKQYIDRDDWDLFFGVFMATDRINHFLFEDYERNGTYREEFLDFYRTLDEHIGELYERLDDDVTLIVASDHGFTTLDQEVHLNTWLREAGWLSFEGDDHEQLADIADETRAYSLIPGRFYVNLEGREPRGPVSQADYADTVAELAEELQSLTDPNGEPVVDRVVRGADVFDGEHDEIAPDLVALPRNGFDLKAGFGDRSTVFDEGPRNGMHTFENATLITDDPAITLDETDLYDLTPTILDIMEVSYEPGNFDGTSLS